MMNAKFSFSARLNSRCRKFVFKKIKSIYFFIILNVWIKDKKTKPKKSKKKQKQKQKNKTKQNPKKEYLFNLLDLFSRWKFSGGGKDSQTRWTVLGGGSAPQAVQKAVVEKMLRHERHPPSSNHTPLILLVLFIHVSLIGFTFKAGRSVRNIGHGWHSCIIACHIWTVKAFTNVYRVWAR